METTDYQVQLLESIALSLSELVKLTRFMAHPMIKEVLEKTLDNQDKKIVYDLMDGEKTVTSIQEQSGVNVRWISEWGQEWERVGIVESQAIGKLRGRRHKLFNLSLYGISISKNNISEK